VQPDERIAAALDRLAERYGLGERQRGQLGSLLELLAADETAPTSVRDRERALDVHLADSLVALELEVVRTARAIADLGAGAGFPGLPLAVALPASRVRLVEGQSRKCVFLHAALVTEEGVLMTPRATDTDGFYIAVMRKA